MEDSEADILLSPVFGGVPGCVEGKVCSGMADHLSSSNIPASDLQLGSHAADDVFEGPEKKLEVFFSAYSGDAAAALGLRAFSQATWSEVLADARCSILHHVGNAAFDAYLLSESSLFVYPHKLILKTCGTTTLLLVLPTVLALAERAACTLSHVHYSHFRFTFPLLQPPPHTSFDDEQAAVVRLLAGRLHTMSAKVVGEDGEAATLSGARWYALSAVALPAAVAVSASSADDEAAVVEALVFPAAHDEPDVFEVAMEGLPPAVCATFFGGAHAPLSGRSLAAAMSRQSGLAALVPNATLDDWAFEPCGYSMNALDGEYYYTVHVTPEVEFSYASFETNDPCFASEGSATLAKILNVFRPASCTVPLPSRHWHTQAPEAPREAYAATSGWQTTRLSPLVAVSVASFVRLTGVTGTVATVSAAAVDIALDVGGGAATPPVSPPGARILSSDAVVAAEEEGAMSSADSESTAPLEELPSGGDGPDPSEGCACVVVVGGAELLPTKTKRPWSLGEAASVSGRKRGGEGCGKANAPQDDLDVVAAAAVTQVRGRGI